MKAGEWKTSDELSLVKMWGDPALSTEDIAKRLSRTIGSVIAKARNMNLPIRPNSPLNERRWSADEDATLKSLWPQNLSAAAIAEKLGSGFTAGSVHYRASALGLGKRSIMYQRGAKAKPPAKQKKLSIRKLKKLGIEMAEEAMAAELTAPELLCVGLTNWKPGQCRFPHGDPLRSSFGWCGRAAIPEKSYCATHHTIAFKPLPPKKSEEAA